MFKKIIKSIFFCLCFSFLFSSLYARNDAITSPIPKPSAKVSPVYQINPTGVGHSILVGGLKEITKEQIEKIPSISVAKTRNNPPLPPVYRPNKKYLRPVLDQGPYGSCAQAAGIGYHYTYAMNLMRDSDASIPGNRMIFFHTWNFLNGGSKDGGSNFLEGWEMGNENGIPDTLTWGPVPTGYAWTKWMSGYDNYLKSMLNRNVTVLKIDISSFDGITDCKHWIKDLLNITDSAGGIAAFSVNCLQPMWNTKLERIPTSCKFEVGKAIIPAFGAKGGHVMNIVGWHDSVWYDVNQDGKITNDSDITMDGLTDIRDWEMGAWLCVNSWGKAWEDTGFFYMMYRVGALEPGNAYADTNDQGNGKVVVDRLHMNNGGLTTLKKVYCLKPAVCNEKVKQLFTFKIIMDYTKRDSLSLLAGVSNDTTDTVPQYFRRFNLVNYQGGAYPMQGVGNTTPIELGLDVKDLLNYVDQKKARFFFMIDSKGGGTGKVGLFSLFDRRGAAPISGVCQKTDVAINQGRNILWIDYTSAENPLVIATDTLPHGVYDMTSLPPYSAELKATGGTAPYNWEQLKNVYYTVPNNVTYPEITTAVTPNDTDDGLAAVPLDFTFPFFGENKDTIWVGTDGIILFNNEFVYLRDPKSLIATTAIAALGYDLLYRAGDSIYVTKDATKATIRWKTKHLWSDAGAIACDLDFAVELYPSGQINYYYKTLSGNVSGMAMGASGGEGNSHFLFEYSKLSEIPASYKTALIPEKEILGLSLSQPDGLFSGTIYNVPGEYRITFAVTDSLLVKKTKSLILKIDATPITNFAGVNLISPLKVMKGAHSSVIFSFVTKNVQQSSLEIFAVNGQKIMTVFNNKLAAGSHRMVWNLDGKNSAVSNGVYLCKLTVGNERVVQRVAVCR